MLTDTHSSHTKNTNLTTLDTAQCVCVCLCVSVEQDNEIQFLDDKTLTVSLWLGGQRTDQTKKRLCGLKAGNLAAFGCPHMLGV